ncbi:RNA polymerase sigma-I factor [Desulforamulus ruminis]|uniref:RNA polymerase sigma factor SigI n=1 Tax=Desulforamulus ruminis (strain ATCC 23193 / DSM 2154 / NCIMB 8452 / DL) TaxID=696281 RepID=F6DPR2_DESRL|nr:RNA polymerase sigma-I factor [Desulforamulus ruminis]AEG59639.1 RNA polymerase sigma-I factor [Desulforamulus ruminis DSM 2154]
MTLEQYTAQYLDQAKKGDKAAREILLSAGKPFVQRTAAAFCGRPLEWGRDEELSVGFIALDEAIDRFEPTRKIPFTGFARLVIKSRLSDYFRKEARHRHQPLEFQTLHQGPIQVDTEQAWENYLREAETRERQEEVLEFQRELSQYGISVEELVNASPKHCDSRENMIGVAKQVAEQPGLMEHLLRTKRLPVKELVPLSGLHRKTIEKGRRYIIAMSLLLHHRERFIYLYSYLKFTGWSEREGSNCG